MLNVLGGRRIVGLVFALAVFAYAGSSTAAIVSGSGDDQSFTVNFDGNVGGTVYEGLTGVASIDVVSFGGNQIILDVTLTNTSDSVIWNTARISAFGFDTNPDVQSATLSSDVYSNVNLGGRFPNGFGHIDLCVINNRNNCSGGASGGLQVGESETMRLVLTFATEVSANSPVEFNNFGVRYQSLSSDLLGFSGRSGTGSATNPIPEPHSTALFLLGGFLVAGIVRKQLQTTA